MVQLFERLVKAFEAIAVALANISNMEASPAAVSVSCGLPTNQSNAAVTSGAAIDYEAIKAGPNGYNVLVKMCNDRGKAVPPRTKSDTLIKWLQTDDAAKAANAGAGAAVQQQTPAADPFAAQQQTGTADPFATAAPPVTRDSVKAKLMKIMETKGGAFVGKIISDIAGTPSFNDVPEDKLAALDDAANKAAQ